VSFRTPAGKVQAVRGIDFDVRRGETLAIVGESGSGKSVTSKAILGILADNALVESGEIIFEGQDLLRISEDGFQEIRGEKISMIFQDPLSSLNPIVRIGKQLTEAMIIKGKSKQKAAQKELNLRLRQLEQFMAKSQGHTDKAQSQDNAKAITKFRTCIKKQYEIENA
jgi:ABC-type microcin C transport system duplicated ATPase subunit YejF